MSKEAIVPTELIRKEAFEHYYAQGMTGTKRSYTATALAMRVPPATIRSWAAADNWEGKIVTRDRKVDEKLDEIAVEKVVQLKARISKNLVGVIDYFFREHYGSEEAAKMSAQMTDIEQVLKTIKMLMLLLGQPDTIRQIEGTVTHTVDDSLRGLSTDELRQLAGRRTLPSAPIDVEAKEVEPDKEPKPE